MRTYLQRYGEDNEYEENIKCIMHSLMIWSLIEELDDQLGKLW